MKTPKNWTLDSKLEMAIMGALDEMKSMQVCFFIISVDNWSQNVFHCAKYDDYVAAVRIFSFDIFWFS